MSARFHFVSASGFVPKFAVFYARINVKPAEGGGGAAGDWVGI